MSLISGFLQGTQAPPKQDATSTIQTLCLRLSSSTLLEDRRAAILGLRSFARDYQELVASEGLRGLIATLAKDREDLDTAKAVLETLLMLFVKDEANPESSEDIALWLTDEFTQKQENITILLNLLEDADFYMRLYTLQLLAAILNNRPARTQECIFTAPLGVTRLVSILEDKRDAIRNEAVLMIIHISAGHTDIQKLITFESAFERIFSIVDMEGGVEGGIVVQDCLQLLSNLLSFNVSNQSYFRETGGVPKLAKLLDLGNEEVMPFAKEQRDTNIQYALRLVRLFVVPGGLGTAPNQHTLANTGILHLVLRIAFSSSCELAVRAEALKAAADLIDGNAPLQQGFAQMQVPIPEVQPHDQEDGVTEYFVIEALLDLALLNSSIHAFDARLAACRCLEAYFNGNQPVREHFLRHAIDLHSHGDGSANALTCLLNLDNESRGDPYRVWIASVILIHLIYDDKGAKVLVTAVREGDAEAGEEEVTAIQGISGNLITALQYQYDPRICIGYLMLLCIWLYGDSDAVDDFLSEGASVQSLVGAVKENGVDPIVQALATFLLGILYEFSHQKSPVTRATLHPILSSRMGRDLYVNKITQLRSHPLIRDFEVSKDDFMPGHRRRKHGLPEVYFDQIFIEFLKDNYSQIMRAIDKDPGLETHITANGITKVSNGVSLELMDSLKSQLIDKEEALAKLENSRLALEQQLSTTHTSLQRSRDAAATETRKLREANDFMRQKFEAESATRDDRNRSLVEEMTQRNRRAVEEKETQIQGLRKQLADLTSRSKAALDDRDEELGNMRRQVEDKDTQLHALRKQLTDLAERNKAALDDHNAKVDNVRRMGEELVKRTNVFVAEKEALALEATRRAEDLQGRVLVLEHTIADREATVRAVEGKLVLREARIAELTQEMEDVREHTTELEYRAALADELEKKLDAAREQLMEAEKKVAEAGKAGDAAVEDTAAVAKAMAEKDEAEKKTAEVQTELEDLFMVLGDLEEKRKRDKKRLKDLGEEVSDDDNDDDGNDDDDDDEEEEDEEDGGDK